MKLLEFFRLTKRFDALERRVKTLEAYMQAEASFRRQAWQALTEAEHSAIERCERALRILSAYDRASEAVIFDGWAVTANNAPDGFGPCAIDGVEEATVIYCRSDKAV